MTLRRRELRKNLEFAAEYLRAALEENDEPGVLLIALRRVAKARGGIAKVAKAVGIERDALVGKDIPVRRSYSLIVIADG